MTQNEQTMTQIVKYIAQHDGAVGWYQIVRAIDQVRTDMIPPTISLLNEAVEQEMIAVTPNPPTNESIYLLTEKGRAWLESADEANKHPHPYWQQIKDELDDAKQAGKRVSLSIQWLMLTPEDEVAIASDVHYTIDNETFNHTFCVEQVQVSRFLGVSDTEDNELMEVLQRLIIRAVGTPNQNGEWEQATLFAHIMEDDHGLTYGRVVSKEGETRSFDTDYAVYAVFNALQQRDATIWQRAEYSLRSDGTTDMRME